MKSRARVLVVDDEHLMRKLVRRVLVRGGYSVAQAASGAEALTKLAQSKYDVVIADLRIPDVVGFDLLLNIKKGWPKTAVIVMTGFGDAKTPDEARRLGADEYITKPFNAREIEVIVERVCWRRMVTTTLPDRSAGVAMSSVVSRNDVGVAAVASADDNR